MDAQFLPESFSLMPTITTPPTSEALFVPLAPPESTLSQHQITPNSSHIKTYSTPSDRWRALTQRDSLATDAFVYAVRTTRIYCRPDCRARLARRANVSFYDTGAQAEHDGFRACKRCKPVSGSRRNSQAQSSGRRPEGGSLEGASAAGSRTASVSSSSSPRSAPAIAPPASANPPVNNGSEGEQDVDVDDARAKIARAVHIVRRSAAAGQTISLAQLAREVSLSKWHLQRVFKRLQGVTPREMAERIIELESRANRERKQRQAQEKRNDGVIVSNDHNGAHAASSTTATTTIGILASSNNISNAQPTWSASSSGPSSEGIATPALDLDFSFPTTLATTTQSTTSTMSVPFFSVVPDPFIPTTDADMDFNLELDTSFDLGISVGVGIDGVGVDVDGGGVEDLLTDLFPELYGRGSGGGHSHGQGQGQAKAKEKELASPSLGT